MLKRDPSTKLHCGNKFACICNMPNGTRKLHNTRNTVFSFFVLYSCVTSLICWENVCTCLARWQSLILPVFTGMHMLNGTAADTEVWINCAQTKAQSLNIHN